MKRAIKVYPIFDDVQRVFAFHVIKARNILYPRVGDTVDAAEVKQLIRDEVDVEIVKRRGGNGES